MLRLGFDIGSNSVGSAWIDEERGLLTTGTSIFPAGVDEADDKRGEPKNAKRRMTRRTRITLARRSARKRELRLTLIAEGLLPPTEAEYKLLLEATDPWLLRAKGLDSPLQPYEFGRVLLHLAQRRGALGLNIADASEEDGEADEEDGKVKKAIGDVRAKMLTRKARTFGEFISMIRADRVTPITSADNRRPSERIGVREFRHSIRNKAGNYEHCADRAMIRHEFAELWNAQKKLGAKLSEKLRLVLDDESGDTLWRHKGFLFGQRRQSWDLGTLGRCVLEPTERCVPHADMHASRYLVVETVNNLRILERGKEPRILTPAERAKIKAYLSGPLGTVKASKAKGDAATKPKTTVSVTDLRTLMGWGRATKTTTCRFNIENDEDRSINTDWFSREIIHGAVTIEKWRSLAESVRDGINHAILRSDPEDETHAAKLRAGVMRWGGLSEPQAESLVAAWRKRPKIDAKRLNMSRKAAKNLLAVMDRDEPWSDGVRVRWLTAIEARKLITADDNFLDTTTRLPLDAATRRRYATGSKGSSARDRHYMQKHVLTHNGKVIVDQDGKPLAEPPPAPLISNPVVRKAIHEVRRHLVAYMKRFGRRPDEVYVELAREAKMGKKDADRLLFRNRLRNRIRNDIVESFDLDSLTATQQRAAVTRVILAVQQKGVCPLCGNTIEKMNITPHMAAKGDRCEVAHIIPRASGGHNGLGNVVLAHTKCNRDMGRRTPREFWDATIKGGFDTAITWAEAVFSDIERPKPSEMKSASGDSLWACYFTRRDDSAKLDQFKKSVSDIQEMTNRQDAATKYAARQVMSYISEALYGGEGLPERGGERRIYATDGMWTSRLRREWGLFFDPHDARAKDVGDGEGRVRREKNRGDHRHHAIDAVVIGFCTRDMQIMWEKREKQAERAIPNSADEEAMENYRRNNPLPPPAPFRSIEAFRAAIRDAVFGSGEVEKAICHRPVKRKLIGALHEETLFGPVLDGEGKLTGFYTSKKGVLGLTPNHLRLPKEEAEKDAIERLAKRREREKGVSATDSRKWAKGVVTSKGYKPLIVDPPPAKSGIVRDLGLRKRIRECLKEAGLNPDDFKASEIKKVVDSGKVRHRSGVPIRSAVLLRAMNDPVIVSRRRQDYATGNVHVDPNPAANRAYLGGNNHHIEIRQDSKGQLSGKIVTAFEASQRKLAKLRAFRAAGIPKPVIFRGLPRAERKRMSPTICEIEMAHPIVDRRDDNSQGGAFVMSLCEGETLFICEKMPGGEIGRAGYYVVAKLDKPQSIVLVPHWDARSATERKDSDGNAIPNSEREQFSIVPSDLKTYSPGDKGLAVKVLVSPLGEVTRLVLD